MPGAHGKNIRRLDHNQDVCPRVLPPRSVPGSPARLRFACAGFRSSSSGATRREKVLPEGVWNEASVAGPMVKGGPRRGKKYSLAVTFP